jgi:hypothetical protein
LLPRRSWAAETTGAKLDVGDVFNGALEFAESPTG